MENFFLGEFLHSFDSQRRITIPSDWRKGAGKGAFYLLPGRHKTIQMIPAQAFSEIISKTRKVSFADAEASLALARLGRMAQMCDCDKQGRIQISQKLYDYAELKDSAVLVGAINVVQIWSQKNWNRSGGSDEQVLDVIQKIGERPDEIADILKGKI
ncbi:MAG TPA: hypothetical protein PK821_04510 [Victivallales bacterium]|nr:hypothetical protein [Victivallales bacterium]